MGDSEGQTLLGGGSSSSSSSEELSSVRSMTSTFLLLSLDDRLGSCVSVLDVSERKQEVDTNTTQHNKGLKDRKRMCYCAYRCLHH